ncbi:MAG: hypothetical protein ACO27M_12430 [Vulcanococcus sp.]
MSGTAESLVHEIAELKLTIKSLDDRLKTRLQELEGAINLGELDDYIADGEGTYVCEGCSIKRLSKTTWTYSAAVKTLKEQEENEGVATKKVSTYLRVTLPKE